MLPFFGRKTPRTKSKSVSEVINKCRPTPGNGAKLPQVHHGIPPYCSSSSSSNQVSGGPEPSGGAGEPPSLLLVLLKAASSHMGRIPQHWAWPWLSARGDNNDNPSTDGI